MNSITILPPAEPAAVAPLRALQLFDAVPAGCVVHAIADHSGDPFLRKGEIVIVDRCDDDATDGGLFLVERGQSSRLGLRTRDVVEITSRMFRSTHGEMLGWWMNPPARAAEDVMSQARRTGVFYCSDGPYGDICHVNAVVIGRVIGIFDPISVRSAS